MNIRTALALVLTLSLAACALMGVAATTAEATDAALTEEIEIATIQEIVTVDKDVDSSFGLYGNTNAMDGKVAAIWYGTYEKAPHIIVTVTTDAVITLAPEELVESTAEIKEAAVTLAWEKIVGGIDFELYGKESGRVIYGSVLLPLNAQEAAISVTSMLGTDGCTGLFGSNVTGAEYDTVTLYNFNNPEDM